MIGDSTPSLSRLVGVGAAVALLVVFVSALFVGGANAAAVSGDPDLDAYVGDPTIDPGSVETLTIQVANDAKMNYGTLQSRDRVTNARNVVVEVEAPDDAPFTIETQRHSIGTVREDQPVDVPIEITVPKEADPGNYDLDVTMEYTYTASYFTRGEVENELTRTETETVTAEVSDDAQFTLNTVADDAVRIGEVGTFQAEVTNTGSEVARDVAVELTPKGVGLEFGESANDVSRLDRLAPGETASVSYRVNTPNDAAVRTYQVDANVEYTDPDGIRQTDEDPTLGLEVGPSKDDFIVEAVDAQLESGSSRLVEVRVTNNLEYPVSNVEAKLSASNPIDSEDDEGFISELDAGESTTMTFEMSATKQAVEKVYAADIDVRYEDDEGRSYITDTYKIPVEVTESAGGGILGWLLPGMIGLTALGGVGLLGMRLRDGGS